MKRYSIVITCLILAAVLYLSSTMIYATPLPTPQYTKSDLTPIPEPEPVEETIIEEIWVPNMGELESLFSYNLETWQECGLPGRDTGFKSWMGYRAITSRSSPQYKLQTIAYSDYLGLRRIGDFYMIAVGTYYGTSGDLLRITMQNGTVFYAVIGDSKANQHTDANNQYAGDGSVLEFIVDSGTLNTAVKRSGNVGSLDEFYGAIEKIERCPKL